MDPTSDGFADAAYWVICRNCKTRYDAVTAAWCSCVVKSRTFECSECGSCFCSAPALQRKEFWSGAPQQLWRRKFASQRAAGAFQNPPRDSVKRPLVLLVEDDREIRAIAARAIKAMDYGVVIARDGQEGLDLARRYRPEVVLTDALMPRLDGREMCRQIKEDSATGNPAVVVMTSLYTKTQQKYEALREFRADRYLSKPVEYEALRNMLSELIDRNVPVVPPVPSADADKSDVARDVVTQ